MLNNTYEWMKELIMRVKVFLCIFVFICTIMVTADGFAAAPSTEWERTYAGANNERANRSLIETDNGYALIGGTYSFGAGDSDVYLILTDRDGNDLAQSGEEKTFGDIGFDVGNAMQRTSDGGFIILGKTESFGYPGGRIYLIKTDQNGVMEWEKYDIDDVDRIPSYIQVVSDGYIITGRDPNANNAFLLKTQNNGTLDWTYNTYGRSNYDSGQWVTETGNGEFVIAGNSRDPSDNQWDSFIKKITNNGTSEAWTNYDFGHSETEGFSSGAKLSDGFVFIGATSDHPQLLGVTDIQLVRTDTNGNSMWSKVFGGEFYDGSEASSVAQTNDGGFIIASAKKKTDGGDNDIYVVRTDSEGIEIWSETYGGDGDDFATAVIQTSDGGYAILGNTNTTALTTGGYDMYLIKLGPDVQDISVSPEALDFGSITVNEQSTLLEVTVSNSGINENLVIGTIDITGTDASQFEIVPGSDNCSGQSLAPTTGECTVSVIFAPTVQGNRTASLVIPSNDPETPEESVSLTGNGVPQSYELTVVVDGTGSGVVTSSPAGIDCGADCAENIEESVQVELTAVADTGSTFDGWSAPCSGTGSCIVSMNDNVSVTATFNAEVSGGIDPEPDIKINGVDNNMRIKKGRDVMITISLDPGDRAGEYADLWILGEGPRGWLFFDELTMSWIHDYYPYSQGPLEVIDEAVILDTTDPSLGVTELQTGVYLFYFGVDMLMDGMLDLDDGDLEIFVDSVSFDIVH